MTTSSEAAQSTYWRKCTTCKNPIGFGQNYWVCSVSTCNRVRTDLVFCNLRCFDAHVPVMNHRDAGAFERKAPSSAAKEPLKAAAPTKTPESSENDILVVVSKVKDYIRIQSGMNTSGAVMELLSDRIRQFADKAIENATRNQRKTVLDRDV